MIPNFIHKNNSTDIEKYLSTADNLKIACQELLDGHDSHRDSVCWTVATMLHKDDNNHNKTTFHFYYIDYADIVNACVSQLAMEDYVRYSEKYSSPKTRYIPIGSHFQYKFFDNGEQEHSAIYVLSASNVRDKFCPEGGRVSAINAVDSPHSVSLVNIHTGSLYDAPMECYTIVDGYGNIYINERDFQKLTYNNVDQFIKIENLTKFYRND